MLGSIPSPRNQSIGNASSRGFRGDNSGDGKTGWLKIGCTKRIGLNTLGKRCVEVRVLSRVEISPHFSLAASQNHSINMAFTTFFTQLNRVKMLDQLEKGFTICGFRINCFIPGLREKIIAEERRRKMNRNLDYYLRVNFGPIFIAEEEHRRSPFKSKPKNK